MNRVLRIVLAEDERDTREYLQELLTRLGHQVVPAANGKALVELARAGEPDLIITDIKMPDMDGIEASVAVNQRRDVPVILVTGRPAAEVLEKVTVDHIMAYLTKPVQEADVAAAIAVAMHRFEQYRRVRQEAADLKQALDDRKLIERAKGAVMKRLRVDEEEAFRRLRKHASDQNRKLVEVARAVVASEDVFQQLDRL